MLSIPSPPSGTLTPFLPSKIESDGPDRSTVWAHCPITFCFAQDSDFTGSHSQDSDSATPSDKAFLSGSDMEGEHKGQTVEIKDISDIDESDQPSLGYLDEAPSFIAAERAQFTAQREASIKGNGLMSENAWQHVIEPRRKQHCKCKPLILLSRHLAEGALLTKTTKATAEADQDADDSSSSFDQSSSTYFISTLTMPAHRNGNTVHWPLIAIQS